MKKKIIVIFITIIISIFFLEFILRFIGFNKFTIYYTNNYYGYYQEPNQNFLSRHGKQISFDKFGNRNSRDNNIQNSELFFLGDSVTYGGSIVGNNETFAYLTSNKLKKKHLNISSNGWGIPNIINFIDFHNLYKKNTTYILTCIIDCFTRNIRKSEQNFFFQKKSNTALIYFYKLIIFKINQLNNKQSKTSIGSDKKFEQKDNIKTINYTIDKLGLLNDKLKELNSKLIFVYSPDLSYIKSKLADNPYHENSIYRDEIFKKINNLDIEFINIIEYFDEKTINNFGKFFADNVHLTKDGHYLYSKILSNLIYD